MMVFTGIPCETIIDQRGCPCVHETCTDGRICGHLEPLSDDGRGHVETRPITRAEAREIALDVLRQAESERKREILAETRKFTPEECMRIISEPLTREEWRLFAARGET